MVVSILTFINMHIHIQASTSQHLDPSMMKTAGGGAGGGGRSGGGGGRGEMKTETAKYYMHISE